MTDGLLVGGLVAPVIGAEVSCGRSGSPSRSTRDEHVPPLLPRPFVDEHVDAVPLLDFKAGREHLEPANGRTALAGDEHAVTRGQNGRFARLVVPIRRVARPGMIEMTRTSPGHTAILVPNTVSGDTYHRRSASRPDRPAVGDGGPTVRRAWVLTRRQPEDPPERRAGHRRGRSSRPSLRDDQLLSPIR